MKITPDDILAMTHGLSYQGWENTESGQRRVAETAADLITDLANDAAELLALAKVKYGNLDADVNEVFSRVESNIKQATI